MTNVTLGLGRHWRNALRALLLCGVGGAAVAQQSAASRALLIASITPSGTNVPEGRQVVIQLTVSACFRPRFSRPTPGLQLAYDPRLPAEAQQFEFAVQGVVPTDLVVWQIDGDNVGASAPTYRWPVTRGEHRVAAAVWRGEDPIADLGPVEFIVK